MVGFQVRGLNTMVEQRLAFLAVSPVRGMGSPHQRWLLKLGASRRRSGDMLACIHSEQIQAPTVSPWVVRDSHGVVVAFDCQQVPATKREVKNL
jgi:hypothetical protein